MKIEPFGFAILNKNGRVRYLSQQEMPDIEDIVRRFDESVPDEAPHRIVELYTKEQMERKPLNSDAIRKIFQMNWNPPHPIDWGKLVRDIEAAHGIVESRSMVNNGIA
jgi:hypothetical protein